MFSLRNFVKKGLLDAVGKMADYQVILNAMGWYEKNVLLEEDLAEIQVVIDEKNTPKPEPELTPEPEPEPEIPEDNSKPSEDGITEEASSNDVATEEAPVVITDEDSTPIEERVGMGEEDLVQETE